MCNKIFVPLRQNQCFFFCVFNAPLTTGSENLALATRGAKATRPSKTMLGEQIGDVLSLPRVVFFSSLRSFLAAEGPLTQGWCRVGSLGGGSTKL